MFESLDFLETSCCELFTECDISAWILEWAASPVVKDLAASWQHVRQKWNRSKQKQFKPQHNMHQNSFSHPE